MGFFFYASSVVFFDTKYQKITGEIWNNLCFNIFTIQGGDSIGL